jgi:hypothetical protein
LVVLEATTIPEHSAPIAAIDTTAGQASAPVATPPPNFDFLFREPVRVNLHLIVVVPIKFNNEPLDFRELASGRTGFTDELDDLIRFGHH